MYVQMCRDILKVISSSTPEHRHASAHMCRADMRMDMRLDMCMGMCIDMCTDMCTDMCADTA